MISNSIRVLVVEDDPAVLLGTQQALQLADFEVEPLADAESALTSVVPDVPAIICDVKLPGLDGLGLLATAHSIDRDLGSHSDYESWRRRHGSECHAARPLQLCGKAFPARPIGRNGERADRRRTGRAPRQCITGVSDLGIPKRTLYDKMRKLGLSTEKFHASDAREAIVNAAAKSVGGRG